MLKIGDFSQLAQVSVRTLRHYEELKLFQPAHIDRFTDYRYYEIDQLPRLNRILALKDLGFSLAQIKHLLDNELPVAQLRGMLTMKQADIEQQLQEGQARLLRVEARLRQIEQEGKLSDYEVVLKKVELQMIASARVFVPTFSDLISHRSALYAELYGWLKQNNIKPGEPELAIYYNAEYTEQDIDMAVAVVVDKASLKSIAPPTAGRVSLRELPAVQTMASVTHHGRFQDVGQAMSDLLTWIGVNGYSTSGAWRELHLFGREFCLCSDKWVCNDSVNFDSVVVEMQIPVEKL